MINSKLFIFISFNFLFFTSIAAQQEIEIKGDGMIFPRMTITEAKVLPNLVQGQCAYLTGEKALFCYDGSSWQEASKYSELPYSATQGDVLYYDNNKWRAKELTTTNVGNGVDFELHQPSLGLNYIISVEGSFPSHTGSSQGNFIGEIKLFAGNFAPSGWAFCDGQILSISENISLYSLLGTTYGGDGETIFKLPDLRGRVPMHEGSGPGLLPMNLGQKKGSTSHVLSTTNLPPHTHAIIGN